VGRNSYAAYDDRAIHLLHGEGEEIAGHTSARVTDLGEQLELTYDAVYAPDSDTGSKKVDTAEATGSGDEKDADGERPGAPPRLVTYVAVNTGDGPAPAVGEFELPALDEASERVDTGFEPEVVEFTAGTADGAGTERTVATSPLAFGWSQGVAMVDRAGTVDHHVLHSSVTATEVSGHGPAETPITRQSTPSTSEAVDDTATADGGVTGRPTPGTNRSGAGGVAFVLDDDGGVIGRETVRMTGVDSTGFEVETERLGPSPGGGDERRPVVFYTGWPRRSMEGSL
jgi:hypothetical protein